MDTIKVNLSETNYNIYLGKSSLDLLPNYCNKYDSVLLLSNDTVGQLYATKILEKLNSSLILNINLKYFSIPDGEEFKTFSTADKIFDFLLENNFFRNSLIITLGGGVVCDLGGFVASTYMRGIDYIQIPTSLLAQVDASIGGKVAINFKEYKNTIGSFYQPKAVFINPTFLNTLSEEQYLSGLGEVIKSALISKNHSFFEFLEINYKAILERDYKEISKMIFIACELKKKIVEHDEKENGVRAFLNLGHTYAHALESAYNFKNLSHGEAVIKGVIFELTISTILGNDSAQCLIDRVSALSKKFNINCIPVMLDNCTLLEYMKKDKKNSSHGIKFAILKNFGELENMPVSEDIITKANSYFSSLQVKSVIDIGTNSIRLLISEIKEDPQDKRVKIIKNLYETVEITQLGKGVNESHILLPEKIDLALKVVKEFSTISKKYGSSSLKAFATSAVRDAENREELLSPLRKLGILVNCISGKEEAEMSFRANTSLFPNEDIMVIDIGGGSTEFTLGNSSETVFQESFDVGAVRVTEKFFKNGDYSEENLAAAGKWIVSQFFPIENLKSYNFKLVGVAATVTTQVTVAEKIEVYDPTLTHLYSLSITEVKNNILKFLEVDNIQRKSIPGLEPKRADVIIAGSLILWEIMHLLGKNEITVSEVDNLEGGIILD